MNVAVIMVIVSAWYSLRIYVGYVILTIDQDTSYILKKTNVMKHAKAYNIAYYGWLGFI